MKIAVLLICIFVREVLHFWDWSMAAAFGEGEELKLALENFGMLTDNLVYTCLKLTPLPYLKKATDLVKAIDRRSCKKSGFYQHIGLKILSEYCSEVYSSCAYLT